jgi:hypothetical protein
MFAMRIAQAKVTPQAIGYGPAIETIQRQLLDISPQNDAHISGGSSRQRYRERAKSREHVGWCLTGSAIQWPFLTILIFWLAVIFASFGLFAPRNGSVIFVLLIGALSVAGALFLIVQMDQPYSGLIKISSAPVRAAFSQLGQQ